jgi:hypothetical protein
VEMSPLQCLRSADFWMLFAINGICSGAGLTLLNNVGQQVGAACWCWRLSVFCCLCLHCGALRSGSYHKAELQAAALHKACQRACSLTPPCSRRVADWCETAACLLQVISLGDRKVSQSGFVSLFSVANCVSRLLAGCVLICFLLALLIAGMAPLCHRQL